MSLVATFLRHFKGSRLSHEQAKQRAANMKDRMRAEAFLAVFRPIFERYEEMLARSGQIDFHDMIARAGPRENRAAGRQGDRPRQNGQALRPQDHRGVVRLPPQARSHHPRGRPGRSVHRAHQLARERTRCPGDGVRLQASEPGQAHPRSFKTVDLKVRPIFHYTPDRVRAHVLLCMLAYYVQWPMRQALAPLLFDDDDRASAEATRTSVVAPARVSPRAQDQGRRKRTATSWLVHSFRTLLNDLATLARNRIVLRLPGAEPLNVLTRPTALQREAFRLLGVLLESTQ